jgi:perosamine synthetase
VSSGGKHSYQSFCIFVKERDRIMQEMRAKGVEVQIGTYALHMHPAFAEGPQIIHRGPFNGSRYAYEHCLTLPLYHDLSDSDRQRVVDMLQRLL